MDTSRPLHWTAGTKTFLAVAVLEDPQDLAQARLAAEHERRFADCPDASFWRDFFAQAERDFQLPPKEVARRFSVPPEYVPTPRLKSVADAEDEAAKARAAYEEVEARAEAARATQQAFELQQGRLREAEDRLVFIKETGADLEQYIANFQARIDATLFDAGNVLIGGPARFSAMSNAYGGVLALRAALADHPRQIARIEAEIDGLKKEISTYGKYQKNGGKS